MDSSEKCAARTKLLLDLKTLETDVNGLQSWARHDPSDYMEALPSSGGSGQRRSSLVAGHHEHHHAENDNVLPEGWSMSWSAEHGKFYFFNRQKGLSQWTKPAAEKPVPKASGYPGSAAPVPVAPADGGASDHHDHHHAAPAPPGVALLELESRLQPAYKKLSMVGASVRSAIEKGFTPSASSFVREQRGILSSLRGELTTALQDLDEIHDASIRDRKRAMTHKIDKDLTEADQLDKHLQQLLKLFELLHLDHS